MAAPWIPVSEKEAGPMFAEAVGSISLYLEQGAAIAAIAENIEDTARLSKGAARSIVKAMTPMNFSAIGTFCFVLPYERYKKTATQYGLNTSTAFGLNDYDNKTTFLNKYPKTIVHTWNPPKSAREGWFADCIRNSFAHGQSAVEPSANTVNVTMWNAMDGHDPNFYIVMDVDDFLDLVVVGLQQFVAHVVAEPKPEPIPILLTLLTTLAEKNRR